MSGMGRDSALIGSGNEWGKVDGRSRAVRHRGSGEWYTGGWTTVELSRLASETQSIPRTSRTPSSRMPRAWLILGLSAASRVSDMRCDEMNITQIELRARAHDGMNNRCEPHTKHTRVGGGHNEHRAAPGHCDTTQHHENGGADCDIHADLVRHALQGFTANCSDCTAS
jgi:hypothetical protein